MIPRHDAHCARRRVGRAWQLRAACSLGVAVAAAGCGESFSAADGSSCVAPTCATEGPSCRSSDFTGPSCPAGWEIDGDTSAPNVVGDCALGKLHVAADDTLDIWARLWLDAPSADYAMHVSARMAVNRWDGGPMLALDVDGELPFEVRAEMAPSGKPVFVLCNAEGCPARFESGLDVEHLFELDVSESGTVATVDCQPFGSLSPVPLPTDVNIWLNFGRMDAAPIDGTLDDVVVSFR